MRIPIPRPVLAGVLLGSLLLATAFLGCGRKGPPVPPRPVAPAAVGSLRAEPRDGAILLTWSRPTRNEDGSPLTDLLEFRLSRAVGTPGPRRAGERLAFSLLATLRAERPENAVVQGDQYAFQDDGGTAGFRAGRRYTYQVQAMNRRGVVGAKSAEVFVDYAPAPPAPGGLAAAAGDGVVDLTWRPPEAQPGAPPPRGYNIYRAPQGGGYASQPINAGPVAETQLRDTAVKNDTTYSYVVRSVAGDRPPWRESANSNVVSATPQDLTPPAAPRGLTAIPEPGVVSLRWSPNTEPDLLGYLVYRREPPALPAVRLTDTPVRASAFTDRAVRAGTTYSYAVTAVDRSPHRNESAPSSEVPVSLP